MVDKIGFVLVILVLMVGVGFAYVQQVPSPGHGGDIVLISINNSEMTLQGAIDSDLFLNLPSPSSPYIQSVSNPGHSASEVWISVNGVENTLQDAISIMELCGNSSHVYNNMNYGHSASEVWISVDGSEMTLQDAIDSGEFCCVSHASSACYDDDVYWYDSCGNREEKGEECGAPGCSDGQCGIRECNWAQWIGCQSVSAAYVNWFVGDFDDCADWCRAYSLGTVCCSFSTGAPTGFQQCSVHYSLATRAWYGTNNGWWQNYCIIPAG
ncbi:hypothetical protein K8R30_03380 [archaeon]|nr:hypothetical protein [archaeon]